MTFEHITVIVVLGIFGVLSIYANKAEKIVEAKAKEKRELQRNSPTVPTLEAPLPNKETKKCKNKSKNKVIV